MKALQRLGLATLALAFGQIVFGAIVRITGSGMGCGDHWPRCLGYWIPPLDRTDLIIEVTHRWIALALSLCVLALFVMTWQRRALPGVSGRGGVLRPATAAGVLVLLAAVVGAIVVKLELHALVVVAHLAIAMALLATLVVLVTRAGGLGAASTVPGSGSAKSARGAMAAAAIAVAVLALGALTANVEGAAQACQGFPLCNGSLAPSGGAHIQFTHRILAFLFFFHLIGLAVGVAKRGEAPAVVRATRVVLGVVILQIVIAAFLVERFLPPALQSLHQAVGTLVWIAVVTLAVLARRAARPITVPASRRLDDGDLIAHSLEPAR
jgi:heme A synthase